jgi:hypothetical protein
MGPVEVLECCTSRHNPSTAVVTSTWASQRGGITNRRERRTFVDGVGCRSEMVAAPQASSPFEMATDPPSVNSTRRSLGWMVLTCRLIKPHPKMQGAAKPGVTKNLTLLRRPPTWTYKTITPLAGIRFPLALVMRGNATSCMSNRSQSFGRTSSRIKLGPAPVSKTALTGVSTFAVAPMDTQSL